MLLQAGLELLDHFGRDLQVEARVRVGVGRFGGARDASEDEVGEGDKVEDGEVVVLQVEGGWRAGGGGF